MATPTFHRPENLLGQRAKLLPLCCFPEGGTVKLNLDGSEPGNNFGLRGKLLWKFGPTGRAWKPLKRRICSTERRAGSRINAECVMAVAFELLNTETALCGEWQPSDLSNTQHSGRAVEWKRISPGGTPTIPYTPSEPAHIRPGANHGLVHHVKVLRGAVIDGPAPVKGRGLGESSWDILCWDVL